MTGTESIKLNKTNKIYRICQDSNKYMREFRFEVQLHPVVSGPAVIFPREECQIGCGGDGLSVSSFQFTLDAIVGNSGYPEP